VKKSFIITRATLETADAAALRDIIVEGTGSEREADSVLRSVERMGVHPSLDHYEVSKEENRRLHGGAQTGAWRVRADLGVSAQGEELPA
jgi:hypothetical protein